MTMTTKTKIEKGTATNWAWRCQECGRKFRSAAAAERAAFGDEGCPGCGGSDIDISLPIVPRGAS